MQFSTEEEVDSFLAEFEAGRIPKAQWSHQAHLAVAGIYIWRDPATALPLMRHGILSLNRVHQTQNTAEAGYHETLTVFWIDIVRAFCAERRESSRFAALNELMETQPSGLFREYYGFDVVKSRRARERWVEPDLKPLPAS